MIDLHILEELVVSCVELSKMPVCEFRTLHSMHYFVVSCSICHRYAGTECYPEEGRGKRSGHVGYSVKKEKNKSSYFFLLY